MLDELDWKILSILQGNARTSNAEIARQVDLAPSATLERIRKLEKNRTLRAYRAVLDPRKIGLDLLAYVFVKTVESVSEQCTGKRLAALPEVLEVHHVAGEDCYLAKVRAASPEALGRILREKFGSISTVTATQTTIVLETIKDAAPLPLEGTDHV